MVGRVALLLTVSATLAIVANAVSPRGLPWQARFEQTLRARALRVGLVPLDVDDLRGMPPDVVLLDARSPTQYQAGHLPGALSLPLERREELLPGLALAKDRRILVYCGTEFCDLGLRLGAWLRERGYAKVALLIEGYDRWRAGAP
jgi:rhodanese-related sulfurtransferase